jgi:hypothetical protein
VVLAACMCVVICVSFFSDYFYEAQITCVKIRSIEECGHVPMEYQLKLLCLSLGTYLTTPKLLNRISLKLIWENFLKTAIAFISVHVKIRKK